MSPPSRRVPLSPVFALLFAAPFGCTAILGDFEIGDATNTGVDGGADTATTTPDASGSETSVEPGPEHFVAKAVTAGARHSCALTEKNEVFCWGDNAEGQLGLPASSVRSERPVKVNVPNDVRTLVAGAFHTCVVTASFEAYCWGRNACGQIGAGDEQTPSPQPRKVRAPNQGLQWSAIAPGLDHTCAVDLGGATYCWGCNTRNQAGNIGPAAQNQPVNASGATGDKQTASLISAGAAHTCIIGAGGPARIRCWGTEERGALGNGAPSAEATTDAVFVDIADPMTAITAGEKHTCALDANKRVACWGDNGAGQLGMASAGEFLDAPRENRVMNGQAQALAVGAGGAFTCGIAAADGNVVCFGSNQNGELGRSGPPDNASHPVPAPVVKPGAPSEHIKARSIGVGREHACAVLDGTSEVVCWGKGADGQLGDGTAGGPPRTMPVYVLRP